ncbi:methyltransferase domain-containing protein, partial [Candidatus Gracilibacteria bacterium]|nr:methyltransferase domain-containing protein [Candidatus Gracilibacteria bacterium]
RPAAANVRTFLTDPRHRCLVGTAEETGLADGSASVVYGEALLTMHTAGQKARIVREAFRVLAPGGRYGIHELCLTPDTLSAASKDAVQHDLSTAIHVGARPLTSSRVAATLEAAGFRVLVERQAAMHVLELGRMLRDEGWRRTLRIAWNILRTPVARRRIQAMRAVFRKHQHHLAAIALVAVKPEEGIGTHYGFRIWPPKSFYPRTGQGAGRCIRTTG